jgi:hypothetical protein
MKKILSIQQPYFFPYIGYFQLINRSETHVILDHVNFKKRSWISRNRILNNSKINYINIPIENPSQNRKINLTRISNTSKWQDDLIKKIIFSYGKTKNFEEVFPILQKIILFKTNSLSDYLYQNISELCKFLRIETKLIISSKLKNDKILKNKDLIISIIKQRKFKNYINLSGGIDLYEKKYFKKNNINIDFIKNKVTNYTQHKNKRFIENMSIIDVLMNIGKKETIKNLNKIDLY